VNQAGVTATFSRPPECMVERQPLLSGGTVSYTASYVITARGFGPEVGVKDGNAPKGSEVWLQSVVTMK
jgi:type IV pilus assembly protein PilX